MTSTSLRPTPAWRVMAREQLRAVALAIRAEMLFVVGLLIVFLVIAVVTAVRAAHDPHMNVGFSYGSPATIPVSILALLLPYGVWRSEEPSRRDYHWSMPVEHSTHTLTKAFFGWMWLMLLVAAYVLFLLALWANAAWIAGERVVVSAPLWEWLVPFTSATVAYLLGSLAVVGSDYPWRWIMGVVIGFLLVFAFLSAANLTGVRQMETSLLTARYGLNTAIFGQVSDVSPYGRDPSVARWLGAAGLWGGLAGAGLWIISIKRVQR